MTFGVLSPGVLSISSMVCSVNGRRPTAEWLVWCSAGVEQGTMLHWSVRHEGISKMTADVELGVCSYSTRHMMDEVPAVTVLDCSPVSAEVPACEWCAEVYSNLTKKIQR